MVERQLGGTVVMAAAVLALVSPVHAAPCGNSPAGFESWKQVFGQEAAARGIKPKAISALMTTTYSTGTIRADRGQKSFKLSLDAFMAKRGAAVIVAKGRSLRAANAALCATIEKRFGVPPGPLLAFGGWRRDSAA